MQTASLVATAFGYHVVDASRNRRKIAAATLKTEDEILDKAKRGRLQETARDADRNWAVASWMVRKHLDFICTQNFHCRNKDRGLRRTIEEFIEAQSMRQNFDVRRRHDLAMWIRIAEARAVLDGDVFGLRLADGTMQGIEAQDCIDPSKKHPRFSDPKRWTNGVYLNTAGAAIAYNFRGKDSSGKPIDQPVIADKLSHHGYFSRFNQVRGVGLITPGLQTLVDTYELFDYSIAKAKVAQLFALAIYRDAETAPAPVTTQTSGEGDETDPQAPTGKTEIDFGKGPVFLDLEPGERAEFLTTQSPGLDSNYVRSLLIIALAALDLPYCWLDASDANFFGNRGALILYLESAKQKRRGIIQLRNEWTDWQLRRAVAEGTLLEPSEPIQYKWQPAGIPFWNPAQEVSAQLDAIDGALNSRRRVVAETLGADWDDLLEEVEYEHQELSARGMLKDRSGKPAEPAGKLADEVDPNWQRTR